MDNQTQPTKKAIYKRWWFWVLAVVVLFGVIGAFNGDGNKTEPTTQAESNATQAYTFDVPSLIGKNVDEVKAVLGTPTNDTEPTQAQLASGLTKEWEKTFTKDGVSMLVTYRLADRSVVDFFISTNDPSGMTKDTAALKKLGNITLSDSRYKIDFVEALKDKSQYTGIKITPTGL